MGKNRLGKAVSIFGMIAIVVATFAFVAVNDNAVAAEYSYEWVSQSDYPTIPSGGSDTLTLAIRNTGTATWYNTGATPIHLGTDRPMDRNSGFIKTGEWPASNRPAVMNEASVDPGEIGTFTFTVVGSPTPYPDVAYREYFRPVVENMMWMEDYGIFWDIKVTNSSDSMGYDADLVSQSSNPTVAPGDMFTLEAVFENTGTETWYNDGSYPIHVGTWNSQDRSSDFYDSSWLAMNRPTGLVEASVAPGAQGTFEWTMEAPSSEGTYTESFNLVAEGKTWFNVPFSYTVKVDDGTEGDVTVSLASDTPVGNTIPKGANGVELAKWKFTGEGTLDNLVVHRYGVGATTAWNNIYLYDGDTRLTNGRTISSSTNEAEFPNLNYDIDGTHYLTLVGDLINTATGQHGFEILNADDVTLANVDGSFPLKGELFAVGDEAVSTVEIQDVTDPANPNVGEHAELAKFKIINGSNDTTLHRITLLQAGDISNGDLSDLELYQGSDLLAETAELVGASVQSSGDKIVFDLDTPYDMEDGISRIFTVKGTTAGRSNRTVRMYLEYTSDILIVDDVYGYGAAITNNYDGTGTDFSQVTLQGGDVTISYSGPTTGDIMKNGQDEVLLNFAISSSSRQIEVRKIVVKLDGIGGDKLDNGGTDLFSDIKIRETDSAYTAGVQAVGSTLMGPKALCTGNDITTCTLTFTDTFYVDGADTKYMQVAWDVANNAYFDTNDKDYTATINAWDATSIKYTDTNQWVPVADIVPATAYTGKQQTVKASTLALSLSGSVSSDTVVTGQDDVKGVGFTFTTGNSDVTVTDIKLTGYIDDNGGDNSWAAGTGLAHATKVQDVVQNVRLYVDGSLAAVDTQIGSAKNVAADGTVQFSSLDWDIASDTGAMVEVQWDVASAAPYDGDDDQISFDIAVAATDVTATDSEGDTVTATGDGVNGTTNPNVLITVQTAGELHVIDDGGTPEEGIILAGNDLVEVAKFRWTAVREGFNLEKLGFGIGLANTDPIAVGQVYVNFETSTASTGDIAATSTDLSNGGANFAKFEGLDVEVPKDDTLIGTVKVNLKDITSSTSAYSDKRIKVDVDDDILLRAVGLASGTVKTQYNSGDDSAAKVQVVRKSKPILTKETLSNTQLFNGTKEIYRFSVAADSAGPIDIARVTLDITNNDVGGVALATTPCTLYNVTSGKTAVSASTAVAAGQVDLVVNQVQEVGAGGSKTYSVECTVAGADTNGESVDVFMDQEATFTAKGAYAAGTESFIWSDQSIFPHVSYPGGGATADYIDSYLVDNLPLNNEVLTFTT